MEKWLGKLSLSEIFLIDRSISHEDVQGSIGNSLESIFYGIETGVAEAPGIFRSDLFPDIHRCPAGDAFHVEERRLPSDSDA